MTKQELIARAAAISGLTQVEIRQCAIPFIQALSEALVNEERVVISGLGIFTVKDYPERKARNPKTGESIIAPARKVVRFKAKKVG